MEAAAAVLAVGDALQSHALLETHDLGDRAVLHRAQRDGVDLAAMPLFTRGQQVVRAQEAADVVMGGPAAWGAGQRRNWTGRFQALRTLGATSVEGSGFNVAIPVHEEK